ncbi:MAG TPA: hypothetical protein VNS32_23295 [Flavisolibacter sp.]|nr:hypothetical protein [Flavisolibacter sp.]
MSDLPYSIRILAILFLSLLLTETGIGQKKAFRGKAVQLLKQTIESMGKACKADFRF